MSNQRMSLYVNYLYIDSLVFVRVPLCQVLTLERRYVDVFMHNRRSGQRDAMIDTERASTNT